MLKLDNHQTRHLRRSLEYSSSCFIKRPEAIDYAGSGPNLSLMHAMRRSFRFMQPSPIFFDPDLFAMQITATTTYRAHTEQSMSFVACSLPVVQTESPNGEGAISCLPASDVSAAVVVL
jgi:hypothetical protein